MSLKNKITNKWQSANCAVLTVALIVSGACLWNLFHALSENEWGKAAAWLSVLFAGMFVTGLWCMFYLFRATENAKPKENK